MSVERLSVRLYRALLIAYPAGFRREYGLHMAQAFRDLSREAVNQSGQVGLARLWADSLLDLAATAPAEHLAELERKSHMERRTLIALLIGLAMAAAVGWVDQHASEVQATLMVLLPAGFVLGVWQPRHAWRWALVLWAGIFVAGAVALAIGWESPGLIHSREVTGEPLVQTPLKLFESIIALVPALVSVYLGVAANLIMSAVRRSSRAAG